MANRVLVQLQLSAYNDKGIYILETDSNFQCNVGRVREWLKHDPELHVDILVPNGSQTLTSPEKLTEGIPGFDRVIFVRQRLANHAIKTRYDFDIEHVAHAVSFAADLYTHVFINDPMLLRHFQAMFFTCVKTKPKFIVQNHFVDDLVTPKFPSEVSMWHGQVEAALRSDVNVFFTKHLLDDMERSMMFHYNEQALRLIKQKTKIWKGCYSTSEINTPVDTTDLRFDPNHEVFDGSKIVVLVPNRVGGMGRSSDYTNAGHFLFHVANEAYKQRQDFVVVAGNPSQKFTNGELKGLCKPLVNLVPDTFRRNEFRYVARRAHITVNLYNVDSHGSTAMRECVDLGCMLLAPDVNEYKYFFDRVNFPFRVKGDLSDCLNVFNNLLDYCKQNWSYRSDSITVETINDFGFRKAVVDECSYENSSQNNMKDIGLL